MGRYDHEAVLDVISAAMEYEQRGVSHWRLSLILFDLATEHSLRHCILVANDFNEENVPERFKALLDDVRMVKPRIPFDRISSIKKIHRHRNVLYHQGIGTASPHELAEAYDNARALYAIAFERDLKSDLMERTARELPYESALKFIFAARDVLGQLRSLADQQMTDEWIADPEGPMVAWNELALVNPDSLCAEREVVQSVIRRYYDVCKNGLQRFSESELTPLLQCCKDISMLLNQNVKCIPLTRRVCRAIEGLSSILDSVTLSFNEKDRHEVILKMRTKIGNLTSDDACVYQLGSEWELVFGVPLFDKELGVIENLGRFTSQILADPEYKQEFEKTLWAKAEGFDNWSLIMESTLVALMRLQHSPTRRIADRAQRLLPSGQGAKNWEAQAFFDLIDSMTKKLSTEPALSDARESLWSRLRDGGAIDRETCGKALKELYDSATRTLAVLLLIGD